MEEGKRKSRIRVISKEDGAYPARMRDLPGMPERLYVIGELPDDEKPSVGIVGARMCSIYGHRTAVLFGAALARHGVQVISGMALGIDSYAQEGALSAGGRSFAVLGGGADVCYPKGNHKLYRQLIASGGVLSEQLPGTPPMPYHFPGRNRIISALSDVLLVVQARRRSGSLITADYALDQGKPVYAVPGNIDEELSSGGNYLIAQGAGIAWDPQAILNELAHRPRIAGFDRIEQAKEKEIKENEERVHKNAALSPKAKALYDCLPKHADMDMEQLIRKSGMSAAEASSAVMELIFSGAALEVTRGRFRRQ